MTSGNDDLPNGFLSIRNPTLLTKNRQIFFHKYTKQRLAIHDFNGGLHTFTLIFD